MSSRDFFRAFEFGEFAGCVDSHSGAEDFDFIRVHGGIRDQYLCFFKSLRLVHSNLLVQHETYLAIVVGRRDGTFVEIRIDESTTDFLDNLNAI
jgi:hypothetical protein